MKELYFKVVIAHKRDLPLTLDEMRRFPTHEMYIAEYEEKLISVMFKPYSKLNVNKFIHLMIRKLRKKYNTTLVEYVERIQTLEQMKS